MSVQGSDDQIGERGNKCGRIADGGHHFKLFDAEFVSLFAGFDINFMKRFDVFGDEGDGNDQKIFLACAGQPVDGVRERRREPFAAAHLALKAQRVRIFPAAALHHQVDGVGNLLRIRISAFDQAERQSVRAEDDVRAVRIVKMRQRKGDFFGDRLDVERMIEKVFHRVRLAARFRLG